MSANKQGIPIWLRKAENDWLNVQNNLASARIPWDTVCFHAQQAIEKSLKALLLHRGIVPPRIHDLVDLLNASPADALALKRWLPDFRVLNGFAVKLRYEGADPAPGQARAIVEHAGEIRQAILSRLQKKPVQKRKTK